MTNLLSYIIGNMTCFFTVLIVSMYIASQCTCVTVCGASHLHQKHLIQTYVEGCYKVEFYIIPGCNIVSLTVSLLNMGGQWSSAV